MAVHHGPPLKDLEGSAPLSDPPNVQLKPESAALEILLNGEDATAHNGISGDCSVAVGDASASSGESLLNGENGTCTENNGLGLPRNDEKRSLTDDDTSASSGETLMMKSQDIKLEEQEDVDERDEDSAVSQFCLVKMELDREEESSGKLEEKLCCGSRIFIPDPELKCFRIPDPYLLTLNPFRKNDLGCPSRIRIFFHPGYRIQGSKKHRILDPDPQHWLLCFFFTFSFYYIFAAEVTLFH